MVVVEGRHTGELDLLQAGAAVGRRRHNFPSPLRINQRPRGPVRASMIISAVLNTSMGGSPSWKRAGPALSDRVGALVRPQLFLSMNGL